VFIGSGAIPLSSFGGEGQGEEVVFFSRHAKGIAAAWHKTVAKCRSIETRPPLPNPLLQRRRGRVARPLFTRFRKSD
jgi:hypothetical protein